GHGALVWTAGGHVRGPAHPALSGRLQLQQRAAPVRGSRKVVEAGGRAGFGEVERGAANPARSRLFTVADVHILSREPRFHAPEPGAVARGVHASEPVGILSPEPRCARILLVRLDPG